jgi:trans-aconitate methyltransferase
MTAGADQIPGIYSRHAAAFDRLRSRTLFEKAWLDRFLFTLPELSRDAAILDLGCGCGEPVARYLIENGCSILGVDTSPDLLGLCRQRFPEHEWLQADMRKLELKRRFDGVLAWNSFFHLSPDHQRAMFKVFADHLAPGGALMFTSGPEAGERIGDFEGEPLYHASLAEQEYRSLLADSGFEVVCHRAEDSDCAGHTVWLGKSRLSGNVPAETL